MSKQQQSPREVHRLVDVLSALPAKELDALVARLGIRIDAAKRLDRPGQVARALVALPELRSPGRLPAASVELLHRVAEAKGALLVEHLPAGLEPLVARGVVFARAHDDGVELLLPAAHLVQIRTWEGEDPRGMRALLAQASFETTSAIAAHYLGRPATPPIALSLEAAWERLGDDTSLAKEIDQLPPTERRVLDAIEEGGGEVDTEELLEIEREPLRLRSASGPTASRRGVGAALERRGLLIPVHPNRHVIPSEVCVIVGASRDAERATRRETLRAFVLSGDHAPRRARFVPDPGPIAIALAIAARESVGDVKAGIGTPKSLIQKLAARFGRGNGVVALISALSRAIGLWDVLAWNGSAPPGSMAMGDLSGALFRAWRLGGAWDEGRPEPEVLRVPAEARDPSPALVLRELVQSALLELGEGRWLPYAAFRGFLENDRRMASLARLFKRWSDRTQSEPIEPREVIRRIVVESLPALGILDLGAEDATVEERHAAETRLEGALHGESVVLRLTARGRALLLGAEVPRSAAALEGARSEFLDGSVLRVARSAKVAHVLGASPLAEVGRVDGDSLELLVTAGTLGRAIAAGIDADSLRLRLEGIAPLSESISRVVAQASAVVGRGSFTPSAGFLWVEDAGVRELLRTRRATAELFLDPSPPGGLLVAGGVDLERLAKRARPLGVEIVHEGHVVRTKSSLLPKATPMRGSSRS